MTTEAQFLVPQETYLKSGIHIGTKFKTRYMDPFIYKVRPDGLSVLNLQKIDERLKLGARLLAQFAPGDILVISRRENGWKAIKAFGKYTGARAFPGRFPPGVLTNPQLETFMEAKMVLATDPWPDRNAIKDALTIGLPIAALCDTNNTANELDFVLPCNNKGKKSLGLIFYILAREYLRVRGVLAKDQEPPFQLEEFTEE